MSSVRPKSAAVGLAVLVLAGWLWYRTEPARSPTSGDSPVAADDPARDASSVRHTDGDSPFALSDTAGTSPVEATLDDASGRTSSATSLTTTSLEQTNPQQAAIDVTQIGREPLGDDDFESLVARLQSDPLLLQQMIDEFRQEQDPVRRALLARLLGDAGGPGVTMVASELIYSGSDEARALGLDLLQRVQPGNAEAREIASGLLATEVEPGVLVDTLTSLAQPGVVDAGSRAFLTDQVALLASHEDARVRGISLDILSRWSTDGRDTPLLLNGLVDNEARVRESAAYALVNHEDDSQPVIDSLWRVAQDDSEAEPTRRAAILALRSLTLSEAQRSELAATERQLDTVRR